MGLEIERKFLVDRAAWSPQGPGVRLSQGYLCSGPAGVVRVRLAGEQGFLTLKGPTVGLSRMEFEYPIPGAEALQMLKELCHQLVIEKDRHREVHGGCTWEIDVFHGANEGLVLAEIELESETEAFARPPWLGREVSGDPRYHNSSLAKQPYQTWGAT